MEKLRNMAVSAISSLISGLYAVLRRIDPSAFPDPSFVVFPDVDFGEEDDHMLSSLPGQDAQGADFEGGYYDEDDLCDCPDCVTDRQADMEGMDDMGNTVLREDSADMGPGSVVDLMRQIGDGLANRIDMHIERSTFEIDFGENHSENFILNIDPVSARHAINLLQVARSDPDPVAMKLSLSLVLHGVGLANLSKEETKDLSNRLRFQSAILEGPKPYPGSTIKWH